VLQNLHLNVQRQFLRGIEKEEDATFVESHYVDWSTAKELELGTISDKYFCFKSFFKNYISFIKYFPI
jgi:hypothetical protein